MMAATVNKNRICLEGESFNQFNSVIGDMLEAIESLRTAATTFPDFNSTAPGYMNPVITVKAFLNLFGEQVDALYRVAMEKSESDQKGSV